MLGPLPTLTDYFPPTEPYLNILHADDDIVVVDKQSGLLSVPGKDPSLWDCVEYRARQTWPTAGMCHRLDKDTSGVLVMALNKPAHGFIGSQFEHRKTRKCYIARVSGIIKEDSGLIDLPLATDWENKPRQRVDFENGRSSQTEWQVIEREDSATRVRLVPRTGRTHQLRVHMKAIGHVILGDALYASGPDLARADRLQLHAAELGFTHPGTRVFTSFVAPTPF